MRGKTKLLVMLSALLLTMCRTYGEDAPVSSIEGLSCQTYTDYFRQGSSRSQGLECYYTCPDKTVGPLDFEVDPGLSAT